jgi:capsular exopolysaccharide synthesis family protein
VAQPRLIATALRWFPILVLGVILPCIPTFLFMSTQPQVYQVTATMLPAQLRVADNPDFDTVSVSRLVGMATNYAYRAKSNDMLTAVAQELNLKDSVLALSKRVDATVTPDTAIVTITARAGSATAAAALANTLANAIQEESSVVRDDAALLANMDAVRLRILETEEEYQRLLAMPPPRTLDQTAALTDTLSLLHELTNVHDSFAAQLNTTPGGLIIVNAADPTFALMIEPRVLYYTLLAAVAGFLLAAGLASVLEYLDETIRGAADIETVAGLRTLGTITAGRASRGRSKIYELTTLIYPRSRAAEAYRTIRTGIELASLDAPVRTLLVTSSVRGEGKTVTAANLAVTFAQDGRRVLLVDADLRNPGVHLVFNVPNTYGLSTALTSDDVRVDAITNGTEQPNLRILTAGPLPPNPGDLLRAQRISPTLDRLAEDYDLIIFDGPPVQGIADSLLLSSFVDGTLVVVAAGRSRRDEVRTAIEFLLAAHATLLGAVLHTGGGRSVPKDRDDSRMPLEKPIVTTRAGERANLS